MDKHLSLSRKERVLTLLEVVGLGYIGVELMFWFIWLEIDVFL
jgi:hypothetical protein